MTALLLVLPQRAAAFGPGAPTGTGLEWLTVAAVIVPALVLVGLVYAGRQRTV